MLHKGCILNLSCITSYGLRKVIQKWKNIWNKTDAFHIGDKAFCLVAKSIIIMRLLIHFFHIDQKAPCSPFEIFPNHCTQEKLETMLMQILEINKEYYGLCETGEYQAFVVPCHHYGMLSLFPGVSFIGRGNCLFSLKCL